MVTGAFASDNEGNDPGNAENKTRSSVKLFPTSTEDKNKNTEDNSEKSENTSSKESEQLKTDSASNYNSSCKFNFLFYFIYKVKYDENGEQGATDINLEF